jgi:amino acid transporter
VLIFKSIFYESNIAKSYSLPLAAYEFLGVEIVAVTAFEARRMRSLRLPSQTISYTVTFLYSIVTIGEALNVDWLNKNLPVIYGSYHQQPPPITDPPSSSLPIVSTWQSGHRRLAGAINGFLIFSVLSASNTALYVASRTLYGMTREIPKTNIVGRSLRKLGLVVHKTRVPAAALVMSAIAFIWLPFVQLIEGFAVQDVCLLWLSACFHISC